MYIVVKYSITIFVKNISNNSVFCCDNINLCFGSFLDLIYTISYSIINSKSYYVDKN